MKCRHSSNSDVFTQRTWIWNQANEVVGYVWPLFCRHASSERSKISPDYTIIQRLQLRRDCRETLVQLPFDARKPHASGAAVKSRSSCIVAIAYFLTYQKSNTFHSLLHIAIIPVVVVECRICNREVAGSNLGYFAPRSTQPSIRQESVNEYQL